MAAPVYNSADSRFTICCKPGEQASERERERERTNSARALMSFPGRTQPAICTVYVRTQARVVPLYYGYNGNGAYTAGPPPQINRIRQMSKPR